MTPKRKAPAPPRDPSRSRILLVEDDRNLGDVIRDLLEMKGYDVVLARDGEEGLKVFAAEPLDLCLVDIMLPRMDGFAVARAIRKITPRLPLIFLTAKSMKDDRIQGFRSGCDDYVVKPFDTEELLLRIEAVLRRARAAAGGGPNDPVFMIGAYRFDAESRHLEFEGKTRLLTQKEADLLQMFARHRGEILERDAAMTAIWGRQGYFVSRSMDVYISRLRRYLADDPRVEIRNIHGLGFKLVVR